VRRTGEPEIEGENMRLAGLGKLLGTHTMFALLVASVGLNVLLAAKVKSSADKLSSARVQGRLPAGTQVSTISVERTDGQPVTIRYADSTLPTVLYVMRPDCGWCKRNSANLKALADGAAGRYRLYVLSIDAKGVEEYAREYATPVPVLVKVSEATMKEYMLGGTPQTVIVAPTGKVLKNWGGAYGETISREIRETLGVTMPGIQPAPAVPAVAASPATAGKS
jgi:hypothetical protein